MDKEITRKSIFLSNWKSKIGYLLNCKDIEEFEIILNYYEQQLKKKQDVIDKAIEYVEEHRIQNPYHYEFDCFMGNARASDLLQILEDKEVE